MLLKAYQLAAKCFVFTIIFFFNSERSELIERTMMCKCQVPTGKSVPVCSHIPYYVSGGILLSSDTLCEIFFNKIEK